MAKTVVVRFKVEYEVDGVAPDSLTESEADMLTEHLLGCCGQRRIELDFAPVSDKVIELTPVGWKVDSKPWGDMIVGTLVKKGRPDK